MWTPWPGMRGSALHLVPAQDLPDGLRASKDGEELAAMEKAQRITDEARKRRSDGHEDDITALVLVLK